MVCCSNIPVISVTFSLKVNTLSEYLLFLLMDHFGLDRSTSKNFNFGSFIPVLATCDISHLVIVSPTIYFT